MIIDTIKNLNRYKIPSTAAIFPYIDEQSDSDCLFQQSGIKEFIPFLNEIEIDGRQLFVRSMGYITKPAVNSRFEIHKVYADLQVVLYGIELMRTASMSDLNLLTEYDPAGDCQFFSCTGKFSDFVVPYGSFVFFYPGEAHCPGCCHDQPGVVRKLVFKIMIG